MSQNAKIAFNFLPDFNRSAQDSTCYTGADIWTDTVEDGSEDPFSLLEASDREENRIAVDSDC